MTRTAHDHDDAPPRGLPDLRISLAQWSLHRGIESGRFARGDFVRIAREELGIDAVELVNHLMEGHDAAAVARLRRALDDHGVRALLIMCDDEGDLSHPDAAERRRAAAHHRKWVDAAAALGCHAVRVNTGGEERPLDADAVARCADGLLPLVDYAAGCGLDVLIENHGGISSRVDLILDLIARVGHPRLGTLPDFGNFPPGIDIYDAVARLMPHARAVSAKCHDFDAASGEETGIDYRRMLAIVLAAGYRGWIGIEYEGERLDEMDGVRRCKRLLERLLARPGS